MSTINRTLVLNPVEPAPISFKLPTGIETWIDIAYLRQTGAPYPTDTASYLYLTARSDRRVLRYPLMSTDPVNGQARAVIQAGDIKDPNGYNVQIIGTVDAEPRLIAKGSASVTETEALGVFPTDLIDTVDLSFEYNSPVELDVSVWQDTSKAAEFDLTKDGTTISAFVYDKRGGGFLTSFAVAILDANTVRLTLTVEQVNALPALCWWSMSAAQAAGLTTLCEGSVTITGTVVPPLVETIVAYDYQKPATGDVNPIGGQIIHSNITQNLLKVSKVSGVSSDFSATLALLIPGDQIAIGGTTWAVQTSVEQSGWYDFTVTPVVQDASSGTVPVTFRRPA